MPTALRIGPYRLYFVAHDCDEPRHIHADRDDRSAKFWLDPDIVLAVNHGYRRGAGFQPASLGVPSGMTFASILRFLYINGMNSAVLARVEPRIVKVRVTAERLSVDLADGRTITAPIGWYPRLAYGTPAERSNVQIVGAGYGLHWPDLDEDISVGGLTLGKPSQACAASFQRWLAARAGAMTSSASA